MTLSEYITHLNYALRGIDDVAPTFGDEESDYWLSTLNRVKNSLFTNTSQNWSFALLNTQPIESGTVATTGTTTLTGTDTFFTDYSAGDTLLVDGETVRTIDTITSDTVLTVTVAFTNTDTEKTFTRAMIVSTDTNYSLNRSFIRPSTHGYITKTDGNKIEYNIIKAEAATTSRRDLYLSGHHPAVLTVTNTIGATEGIIGGTLSLPGYYMPADVTLETDLIPVPDPFWAVMAVASEIAFNDITYEDKASDLNAKANALYRQMVSDERKGTYNNPIQTPVNVYRIGA